jgi:CheY-like chemotaxis protein
MAGQIKLVSREIAGIDPTSPRSMHYFKRMNPQSIFDRSNPTEESNMHTILVVEDELMVRMPIVEYLRDCGYHVVEASDATEAIAATDAEGSVSVVFSDIRMPGKMDGFGLAEWFRSHHPEVPVLLTSGYNGARSLGSNAVSVSRFIEKPYSQTQVARRIAALLHA